MMTAGRGVVHAEMPAEEIVKNGGRMEGFQLWVNLPAKVKSFSISCSLNLIDYGHMFDCVSNKQLCLQILI